MSIRQFLNDNFPELGEDKIKEIIDKFEEFYEEDAEENEIDWNDLDIEVELDEITLQ